MAIKSCTWQRPCETQCLLPYIYEHNRGGASSQSCTETEANNITIYHQSWTLPPLVWIYIHNRGVWLFLLDKFAFLSTSSGQLCSQNRRCSTKNLKQRWLRFFVEHLCCVHKCKGRRCSMQNLEHHLRFFENVNIVMCKRNDQHLMLVSVSERLCSGWGEHWLKNLIAILSWVVRVSHPFLINVFYAPLWLLRFYIYFFRSS